MIVLTALSQLGRYNQYNRHSENRYLKINYTGKKIAVFKQLGVGKLVHLIFCVGNGVEYLEKPWLK